MRAERGAQSAMPSVATLRYLAMLVIPGLFACSSTEPRPEFQPSASGKTLVYECGDYEFVVRTGAGQIALYLPGDYLVLEQVRTASGSKYSGSGVVFWSKGESAMLDLGHRRYGSCHLNRARGPWEEARRRGVQFRAVGQEPGWSLEIQSGKQMLLVSGYGQNRVLLPTPEPVLEDGYTVYHAHSDEHDMRVEVSVEFCQDTMSGEVYENSVKVTLDGNDLQGCGIGLESDWE